MPNLELLRPFTLLLLLMISACPLAAHQLDPVFLRKAGDQLVRLLETPVGKAALERVCVRLSGVALETIEVSDRSAARRAVLEHLPRDLGADLRRGAMVDEVAEVLLLWGGTNDLDARARERTLRESLATFQVLRRIRARILRDFPGAREPKPPALPRELSERFRSASSAEIQKLRRRWLAEVIPGKAPKAMAPLAIQRFDADGDHDCETRAIDSDLDGSYDLFEADLDGDRVFESVFTRKGGDWIAGDSLQKPVETPAAERKK